MMALPISDGSPPIGYALSAWLGWIMRMAVHGNEVFVAGRRKNGWIDEVNREAAAVQTALAEDVTADDWTVIPIDVLLASVE